MGRAVESAMQRLGTADVTYIRAQNSTAPGNAKGKAIIHHAVQDSRVHLFVRKNKLEANKGAPFYYCGALNYVRHKGEKPMNVEWLLEKPLSDELFQYFLG